MLALVVYVVVSAAVAGFSLLRAQHHAQQVQRALSDRQTTAVAGLAHSLGRDFFWAHTAIRGPGWWLASKTPFVGDDVAAVRTMAAVGDELTHGAGADLVGDSSWEKELTPRSGHFDLEAIASAREPVDQTYFELQAAVGDVGRIDPDHLIGPMARPYRRFAQRVRLANTAMATASRAVRVLPTMLGADGPRVYLLLFDNNAEIRATGGLPGQFAEIRADDGQLTMIKQGTPTDIGHFPQPVVAQPAVEKQVYGERMAEFIQDANVTPDFPRTAEVVRGMWSRSTGEQLDGVWSLDTVSISYLLRATGPVKAPDGTQLTTYNSTDELLHGIYMRTDDKGEQDEFFSGFAKNLFDKIISGDAPPLTLASALSASTNEGRAHVYDFNAGVQAQLSGTPLAGELPAGGHHPQVGVYFNNAVPSKLSYYLRPKVTLTAQSCGSGQSAAVRHGAAHLHRPEPHRRHPQHERHGPRIARHAHRATDGAHAHLRAHRRIHHRRPGERQPDPGRTGDRPRPAGRDRDGAARPGRLRTGHLEDELWQGTGP